MHKTELKITNSIPQSPLEVAR